MHKYMGKGQEEISQIHQNIPDFRHQKKSSVPIMKCASHIMRNMKIFTS